MAVPGLWCCAQAFSACSARASRGGGFSCCGAQAFELAGSVALGLSSCGARA